MDTFELKPVSIPTQLNPNYKKIRKKTRSLKNESIEDQILNSPQVKLSLNDTILLDGRDTEVAFPDFIFALKRNNVDFPDIYYTILGATGINPQKNKQRCQKQRQRELDSIQNLKKPSYKDCIEMEKPHMDQLKIYKRQVGYPIRNFPTFCTVKIPTQNIVMQHDISKDYQHLLSESIRSGVSI